VIVTALSIAGSDSSGGAGIQADLKTMAALGVHGTTAVTSITAQNTRGVFRVLDLPPEMVAAQIDAVLEDVGADAAKTGMLPLSRTVEVVADRLRRRRVPNVVVDPVMVATSGARLSRDEAVAAMREALFPLALVVTPNVPEAEVLTGMEIRSPEALEEAARIIRALGPRFVLIKGGHLEAEATDLLFDGRRFRRFEGPRLPGGPVHGTGCSLSAAIAAGLARGSDVETAVADAKAFVTRGIASALSSRLGGRIVNPLARESGDGEGSS